MNLPLPSTRPVETMDEEARVDTLVGALLEEFPPANCSTTDFLGAQFDAGLAWIHFPEGSGGLGLSARLQKRIAERLARARAPQAMAINPIGFGMCGPTVATWGNDEQRQRYLRPLFTCDEIWCQLFSEPGAGSDFAGLSSRAVKDGDDWVVNGEKVWTTLAHISRWGLLVVRTDPEAVKHAGLTAFVVDMQSPGVGVLPLRQMTGEAEFNQVFFTDVRIPDANRLGSVGDGWRVSLTTLMNERVSVGGFKGQKASGPVRDLLKAWRAVPREERTAVMRDRVVKVWSRAETLRLTNIRAGQARTAGDPGPEGSIGKATSAELNKDLYNLVVDLMGPAGVLYGSYEITRPDRALGPDTPQKTFLRMRANSIEGGTTEVMKNILAERVLGLPGDVRVDRDVPWSSVPRN